MGLYCYVLLLACTAIGLYCYWLLLPQAYANTSNCTIEILRKFDSDQYKIQIRQVTYTAPRWMILNASYLANSI